MSKRNLIVVILIAIIALAVIFVVGTKNASAPARPTDSTSSANSDTENTSESSTSEIANTDSACPVMDEPTITYTNDSFSPACVTVDSGTTVTWINNADQSIEVGTDPHPSHAGNREISNDEFVLIIPAGGEETSQLNSVREHAYHNHLEPAATGRIIVR